MTATPTTVTTATGFRRRGRAVPQLANALAVIDRGWFVFPLPAGAKFPGSHMKGWPDRATNDPDRVARWWTRHPYDNPAVACGPSGLVVIDPDQPKPDTPPPPEGFEHCANGLDMLAALVERAGQPPPATYTVRSARQGLHLYFTAPDGVEIRNSKLGWLLDVRANGGYVVAAGALAHSRLYIIEHDAPVAPLPAWMTTALAAPPAPPRPSTVAAPIRAADRYGAAALAGEVTNVATAAKGDRNERLFKACWKLAEHIAAGRLSRAEVEAALQHAGEQAGEAPKAVVATIRCALDKGIRRHGGHA